ncbi:MAG: ATP-dependent helicase, partial [Chloroflexota bacterium]|nr:ATP-dependent helicase [Chloroflexota bacterium]
AQRRAVDHREGPLRIVAGAGAGKTHTLTQSVLSLIKSGAAHPEQILALTFTRKAAEELRERMGKAVRALDPNLGDVDVDTYNAFGGRIVAQHGHKIGLPPDPTILSTSDAWILLWRVLDRIDFQTMDWTWPRGHGFGGGSPLRTIIDMGSRLRDELREPSDLAELLSEIGDGDNPDLGDICRALTVYDQRKHELGAIDYGDQIALACQLLERDEVRDFYAATYRFMMVDEFQDTNFAQRVMVRRLGAAVDANIRVVGDPNQAIYSFRGAAPDNLERFVAEDFPESETIPLTANYRSTIRILDFANALWDADPGEYRGNLEAAGGKLGEKVVLAACVSFADEAAWIAREIARLRADGTPFRDIAILVRKNAPKRLLHRALTDLGVPIEVVGGSSLYEQREIRLLISALRVVAGEPDDTSFAHLLTSDRWGVDEASLYSIARHRERGESLVEVCRRIARRGGDAGAEMLAGFMESLDHLVQRAYLSTLPSLVDRIARDLLGALDPVPAANVARFKRVVQQFAESQLEAPSLKELVIYLDLLLSADPEDEAVSEVELGDADTVKLMTFHAAKGLEWPVVFVAMANSHDLTQSRPQPDILTPELVRASKGRPERGDFPPNPVGRAAFVEAVRAWEKSRAAEEERRVLYVALTRARDRLYLSWSANNPTRKTNSELHP